jgi:hypothetical protein
VKCAGVNVTFADFEHVLELGVKEMKACKESKRKASQKNTSTLIDAVAQPATKGVASAGHLRPLQEASLPQ